MKLLGRSLIWVCGLGFLLWVIGLAAAKALERGAGAQSDEFRIAAFWGGRTYKNHSASLCSGVAITALGGVELDLSQATLHPGGAELALRVYGGGIKVRVPRTWRIDLHKDVRGGQLELLLDDSPDAAPVLDVDALIVGGALEIQSVD